MERRSNGQVKKKLEVREPDVRKMLDRAREFLRIEARALHHLAQRLDGEVCAVANLILRSSGIVVVTGIGKSRLVGEKISATLSSTGTRSITLNPTDAMHGDLGQLRPEDILLCLSNSGETAELSKLVVAAKRLGVTVIAITGNGSSSLARMSDFVIDIGPIREACPLGLAPTTSTTAQMAVGDSLALVILEQRGFSHEDFARCHPAGSLGQRLMRVDEIMRSGDRLPLVSPATSIKVALLIMNATAGRPGAVVAIDSHGRLLGAFTQHELEPLIDQHDAVFGDAVGTVMRRDPPTIVPEASVEAALSLVQRTGYGHLVVVDDRQQVVGLMAASDIPDFGRAVAPAETRAMVPLAS
jgi:arabinose-5-phosphate isomerase